MKPITINILTVLGCAALLATAAYPTAAAVVDAWVQRYNGPATDTDPASAVTMDSSGNVVVTQTSYNGTNNDYYTAKYAAANGSLLWENRYNGPANSDDQAAALAVDSSGNVVVTGRSHNGTNYDCYTAKYAAADGALLWEKRYNGPENSHEESKAVAVDGSGNVAVTGSSYNGSNYDYYTAKYAAADGTLLWEKRYSSPLISVDVASAVAVDSSGNVIVTGGSAVSCTVIMSGCFSMYDYYTAKYAAADGALLWEKRYNGTANRGDYASAVAVDGGGNVVVTGYSGIPWFSDYYTAKYAAANGALLWEKRYSGTVTSLDEARAVAVDGSGNVVVTGQSDGDYYTAKYAGADGALLWEKRYSNQTNSFDDAYAIAVDGSGNVVVTGASDGDYYTAKYAATDGMLLWEKRYNGPANGSESMVFTSHTLALGPCGSVAITGFSQGESGSFDYATILYRELPVVSIDLIFPGRVRLRFMGEPGRRYDIARAPAVTGPWMTIATPVASVDCRVEYTDTMPPPGMGFYCINPMP